MTTIYMAIGACFLLNLIILIAFRTADRKDTSLKKVNQQVKNFRSEVSSTINRMTSTARDCEQNITSRIEHAQTVQTHLAESIDMVLVHQKELDNLSGVCESYGNALQKLKIQTEQAENRIYAVQAEVRKIEAVNDYALQFQKDIERLTNQLDSIKSDYVRLVASTEQDLKNAASNQKEENNQMLLMFTQALDRAKSQFADYVADERKAFDESCVEQESVSREQLRALDEKINELDEKADTRKSEFDDYLSSLSTTISSFISTKDSIVEEMNNKVEEMKEEIERSFSSFEEKKEMLIREVDDKLRTTIEDLDSAIRSTEDTLEERLNDKEEEISSSLENSSEKLNEKEKEIAATILQFNREKEGIISSFNNEIAALKDEIENAIENTKKTKDKIFCEIKKHIDENTEQSDRIYEAFLNRLDEEKNNNTRYLENKAEDFKKEIEALEKEREQYKQRCKDSLADVVDETRNEGFVALQRIKSQGEEFLKTVSTRILDTEKAYNLLTEITQGKVKEAAESLEDYQKKIKECEVDLSKHQAEITNMKEAVWNLQQQEKSIKSDIDSLKDDRSKIQNETAEAKNKRINEEANLVRLKGQISIANEKNKEVKKERKKPIFEEVDIIIGDEEEVDVSDDDL